MQSLSKNKLFGLILFLSVMFMSGHAFQTMFPMLVYVIYIFAAISILCIMCVRECRDLIYLQNVMLWITIVMILSTMFIYLGSGWFFYLQLLTTVLTAYLVVSLYSFEVVSKYYLKLMTVVSMVALIGYILVNNTSVMSILPRMRNSNGVEYGVGIIYNYIVDIPERNCGMFWEPGLFATHLTIATVIELITKEKASLFRLVLFTACFFTANSSAGFVLWFLCIVLLFIRKNSKKYNIIKNFFSMIVIGLAVFIILNFDNILATTSLGGNEYFQKLSSDTISDSTRSNAILHNLKVFASDPIFGAGYTTVTKNIAYVADTSTSTYLMSIFGILGISYTVFIVYGVMRIKNANLFAKIVLLTILLIIVNKEPHQTIILTWVFIFYLMKGIGEKEQKIKNT